MWGSESLAFFRIPIRREKYSKKQFPWVWQIWGLKELDMVGSASLAVIISVPNISHGHHVATLHFLKKKPSYYLGTGTSVSITYIVVMHMITDYLFE